MKRTTMMMIAGVLAAAMSDSAEVVPFDSERWAIQAAEHRLEQHLGRASLYLRGGAAVVADSEFTDGVIEFDIAFEEARGFSGVFWRMQDDRNFEDFYLRPHQSGNPDSMQYTPVFNGVSGWQLYHGEGYGAVKTHRFDAWMHVRLVVSGDRAEIYIDSAEPVLVVDELKRERASGNIGIKASEGAPAWFSNFSYEPSTEPTLRSTPRPAEPTPPGTVTSWIVSSPFAEADVDGRTRLTSAELSGMTWSTLSAEAGGITNLARIPGVSRDANTVVARVTLRSSREQVVRARFGYSDRVRVYLNEHLLYSGTNGYRTRDYRYLGTVGLFDEVWLPLRAGDNELWFAVSEDFGGFGILCRVDEAEGVSVIP